MAVVKDYGDMAVFIVGGTAGVGLATAKAFASAGVRRIAVAGRRTDRGDAAREEIAALVDNGRTLFVQLDARDFAATTAAVDQVRETFGCIDVAMSSVTAHHVPELLVKTDSETIRDTLTGLVLPVLHLTRAVLPIMQAQKGGSIINVASDAAKIATPGESVIGAAMAAIVMFSRTVAIEAKRDGVRVNAVTPSLIAGTETTARVLAEGFSARLFEKAAQAAHLGVAEPEDLAALAVFLGGPASAKLTGQAISVNGGISAA